MVGDRIYFLLENQWPENFRLELQPNTNHSPTKLRPSSDRTPTDWVCSMSIKNESG